MGYTIVELMIFLAVSGGLFVMATVLISGKQEQAQFAQGVRDFESKITDIMSDVNDGYYPSTNTFNCIKSAGTLVINNSPSAGGQGTNLDCVFLGKVLRIGSGPNAKIYVDSVIGLREKSYGQQAVSFSEAQATANDYIMDSFSLNQGIEVTKVTFLTGGVSQTIGSVGFFKPFNASLTTAGNSSANSIDVVPVQTSSLGDATSTNINAANLSVLNPDSTVICLRHGSGARRAAVLVGGSGSRASVSLHIGDVDTNPTIIATLGGGPARCPA